MRLVLDSFAVRDTAIIQEEHGASIELARRITALGRVPDIVALADLEVFPELLMPAATSWYAAFARNRMVVAYTDHSRFAAEINSSNWRTILQRPEVTVGRSDPAVAPVGYRALIVYALAERFYHEPGLSARLAEKTSAAHIRGNATELAALLKAGEIDYIVDYESLAKAQGFKYVTLPVAIDLSDPEHATDYATGSVRISRLKDSVTRRGAPILYGLTVPRDARHQDAANRFLAFMLSARGKAMLRRGAIDMLDQPVVFGVSAPAELSRTP
jgi:molybdate/tungstate transport system substrate-binding protein